MKDMGIPQTWCGIEFTFLPDTIILHQTAYRKHCVEHWRKHPVHPMSVTPHLSPIKDDTLRYKEDASGPSQRHNWLLITGADITPATITLVSRGLGHATPDHEDAAEPQLGPMVNLGCPGSSPHSRTLLPDAHSRA